MKRSSNLGGAGPVGPYKLLVGNGFLEEAGRRPASMKLRGQLISRERFGFLRQRNRQEQDLKDQPMASQARRGIRLAGPGTDT